MTTSDLHGCDDAAAYADFDDSGHEIVQGHGLVQEHGSIV